MILKIFIFQKISQFYRFPVIIENYLRESIYSRLQKQFFDYIFQNSHRDYQNRTKNLTWNS